MIKSFQFVITILLCLTLSPLTAQDWRYNCPGTYPSPDGRFSLSCWELYDECVFITLSLKGAGIKDSIILSKTSLHDCHEPSFFWVKNSSLLLIESNDSLCDGEPRTQLFDLKKRRVSHTINGKLCLFDEKNNIAIIYHEVILRTSSGDVSGSRGELYAYDIVRHKQQFLFSFALDYAYDCTTDRPEFGFLPGNERIMTVQFPGEHMPKLQVRY